MVITINDIFDFVPISLSSSFVICISPLSQCKTHLYEYNSKSWYLQTQDLYDFAIVTQLYDHNIDLTSVKDVSKPEWYTTMQDELFGL